ncbi:MAG: DUF86 domain-containing protein [Candidatus Hydrogenedentes bacterium]|nr:DUF86 domain-containing protein [Candidatus Hydrogenedentota bacterium]
MLLYAKRARDFCRDVSLEAFVTDEKLQMAALYALQVVGEAASKVSPEFQQAHPEIPWPRVINLRHRLVHDYPRVETPRVWSIVKEGIPALIESLEVLVLPEEKGTE